MSADQEELARLRRDLYRPDPPGGTRERYETLLAESEAEADAPPARTGATDPARPVVTTRRRSRLVPALAVVAAVLVGAVALAVLRPTDAQTAAAEPLVPHGPSASADRAVLAGVLRPGSPAGTRSSMRSGAAR